MTPRVKVCGLTRHEDAAAAARSGAVYAGVILAPGRSRSIDLDAAAAVFGDLPLRRVGVFVDAEPAEIRAAIEALALDVVQLHGDEPPARAAELRERGVTVWKALRPRAPHDLLEGVELYRDAVDGLLLDGWSPHASGGTGASFGWDEIAPHRGAVPPGMELIVAGGLRPENVGRAVALLRPDIVDVSSGVESAPGRKDHGLIREFVAAAGNTRST